MNPTTTHTSQTAPDSDLAEQARPGHGVPSQDPAPAAQYALSREEAERESNSSLMGGGFMAGAAAGAAVGAAVAGPVGVFVGSTVGAVAGTFGGAAAGKLVEPARTEEDAEAAPVSEKTVNSLPAR
ncbi:hypothetical protein [Paracidovorax valerianellae]|uniref:hypothetical protein n=1 Tax=Paracidovorax valerianellae TaxID=187868 RepID=UPI000B892F75|nr:hypothetical protein [Paracidovorax valerianellae]MDA8445304.1 hypothetical protein [Paracidovorax valerianellae]